MWLAQSAWWLAPAAVAAGAAGTFAISRKLKSDPRRLAYEASKQDLVDARRLVVTRRAELQVARAEYRRLVSERKFTRETGVDLSGARKSVRDAERAVRAAEAGTRAAYAKRTAARQELPMIKDPEKYPLARVKAQHDSVLRRWLEYETDPGMVIDYPGMTDGSVPATSEFLVASQRAGWLRPLKDAKVSPAEFSRYRDAVHEMEEAFENAEAVVLGKPARPAAPGWQDTAQSILDRSAEVVEKVADVAHNVASIFGRGRKPE